MSNSNGFNTEYLIKNLAKTLFQSKIMKVNSKMHIFCSKHDESIGHKLLECDCLQSFLDEFNHYLNVTRNSQIVYDKNPLFC